MNTKFGAFIAVMLALMVVSLTIKEIEKRTPVPVEVTQPEQSHYAVFYVVCGLLQHVLVTTDPPFLHSMAMKSSQELLDLLEATPQERMIELTYAGPECYYANPRQAPAEPIL